MRVTTGPWRGRPDLDRTVERYFVYTVLDAEGQPLYIGRSCNVANRLRAHHATIKHQGLRSATWILDARSVTMTGPYTWDEAVRVERERIQAQQPPGNIALTDRGRRSA